jgi:alpha-galactosidase
MWAVLASPLLLSQNIRNLSAYQLATYLNREVIAVNQDRMGKQGKRLVGGNLAASSSSMGNAGWRANVWGRPLADGSWAIVFVNAEPTKSVALTCDLACFNETGWDAGQALTVRDLWLGQNLPHTTPQQGLKAVLVPNGGVAMYVVKPILN